MSTIEHPTPTLESARAAIAAAKTEKRALTPTEVATVISATSGENREAVLAVVNPKSKNVDMRDSDRRDALGVILDGIGAAQVETREERTETWAERQAEATKRADATAAAFDEIKARPVTRGKGGTEPTTWLPGLGEYRELRSEQRAIGTTGAFIPVGYANTFQDQLRKRTAVLAAGPQILPVESAGSLKVPAITASVTVAGVAEAGTITPADPTLTTTTLDPKKFAAMTLVNREAVEDSSPELRTVIGNALLKDLAVKLDEQLVTGDGTGQNLLGLRNITGFTAGATTGTNGGALTFAFLADTLAAAEAANLDPDRLAWIIHARTWGSVRKLSDSQARPIVSMDPTVGVRPALWGKPVYISNSLSITETVGTSTDCSVLLLCDMSQILVGVAREVELVVSEDFKFDTDQIAIRATARYDIAAPQPTAIVKTVGIRP
jgi:HK97 family phage major capsid protein